MSTPATPTTSHGISGSSANLAPGVQMLLDAEKEANRQVQQARQNRVQRLKDARNEAQKEIEALKQEKAEEYTAYERSVMIGLEATIEEYARDTAVKLEQVRETGESHTEEVIGELLKSVINVETTIHPNASLRMKKKIEETSL